MNSDNSYESGYQPSLSSTDQMESFAYCRTNSEVSGFSTDDTEAASQLSLQGLKSPARLALSKLGMRQNRTKDGLDEEVMDLELRAYEGKNFEVAVRRRYVGWW